MIIKRILLKNQTGTPVASVTFHGDPPFVTLPKEVLPLCYLSKDGFFRVNEKDFALPVDTTAFSILAQKGEELLFASTLSNEQASFAKWRLLSSLETQPSAPAGDEAKAPTESLETPILSSNETNAPAMQEKEEPAPATEPPVVAPSEEELPPESEDSDLSRAENLLRRGVPFHLFDELMPGSRWAIIKEDAAEYLIGITSGESGKHLLFGVPGARDFPPDEERLWSFFSTSEDDEIGYFLTQSTELREFDR